MYIHICCLCSFTHMHIHKFITCIPVHKAIQTHTEACLHLWVQAHTHTHTNAHCHCVRHSLSPMCTSFHQAWTCTHLCTPQCMHYKHVQKQVYMSTGTPTVPKPMCYPEFQSAQLHTEPSLKPGEGTVFLPWPRSGIRCPSTEQAGRGEGIPTDSISLLSQLPCREVVDILPWDSAQGRVEGPGGQSL